MRESCIFVNVCVFLIFGVVILLNGISTIDGYLIQSLGFPLFTSIYIYIYIFSNEWFIGNFSKE